jgi:hypothetical protein
MTINMRRFLLMYAFLGSMTSGALAGQIYDAAADFSIASNPNGVWSYGYELTLGSGFQSYNATATNPFGATGLELWYNPALSGNFTPLVGYNTTSSDVPVGDPTVTVISPAHSVFMHPGAPTSGNAFSVLRWTAPTAGSYQIAAAFRGDDFVYPTTTDVHVLENGSSLFDGGVYVYGPAASFTGIVSVKTGDTIDFVVGLGSDGNYTGDTTGISATISTVPEPTGALLLALGVGIVGAIKIGRFVCSP